MFLNQISVDLKTSVSQLYFAEPLEIYSKPNFVIISVEHNAIKHKRFYMKIDAIRNKIRSMTALYVEDDDEVRIQSVKILKLFFDTVIECSNAKDGIDKFKSNKIDIVFTDINMPNINGLEMIERIKSINPLIKVVIFSAYDEPKFFTKAINLAVDAYILKPFSTDDLLDVFKKIAVEYEVKCKNLIHLNADFVWDRKKLGLFKDSNEVKLTKHEILLLKLLLDSKERVVSSLEIENELFDDDLSDNKRIRNIISRLHKKIGYKLVENLYSQGYRIKWR